MVAGWVGSQFIFGLIKKTADFLAGIGGFFNDLQY
jgi:hypothetical protein